MTNETTLPVHGSGSIQRRGRVWWMSYRDANEVVVQENTHLEDRKAALRLLAQRALPTFAARMLVLHGIACGKESDADKIFADDMRRRLAERFHRGKRAKAANVNPAGPAGKGNGPARRKPVARAGGRPNPVRVGRRAAGADRAK